MVHADASNFASGVHKEEAYNQILEQAEALFDGQRNWVCNLANAASLLWHAYKALPSPSCHVNWAGFYVLDSTTSDQLILGPFHGKVACQTIRFGRGVCGTAAETAKTQLVPDVEQFPSHIACDGDSKSEIVVPIAQHGRVSVGLFPWWSCVDVDKTNQVVGIIDVDCAILDGFDESDQAWLEKLSTLLAKSCDFGS